MKVLTSTPLHPSLNTPPVDRNSRGCTLKIFLKLIFGLICCQLEDEVEKLLGDNKGLVQSDHALKLSRLMVRAETTEQRIMLLKILQVNIEL